MRRLLRVLLAFAVMITAGLGIARWIARPEAPDDFYAFAGPSIPEKGTLIASQPFTRDVPGNARAWRILYATTRYDGTPAVASAIAVAPVDDSSMPRNIVAWAHGTTGVAPGCAPSVVKPFANVPAFDDIIRAGWAYVATDYPGLGTAGGHAYLQGEDAARSVLDAVRAARHIPALAASSEVVVWGHSQGGHSALWTGQRAASYAPDLHIVGIAALAPASDLRGLVSASKSTTFGKIVSAYLMDAYERIYSDVASGAYVDEYSRLLSQDIAGRCVGGWETLISAAEAWLLPTDGLFAHNPAEGPLAQRLAENTPTERILAPVLIAQGESDDLVLPAIQGRYVESRCAAGQVIDYRTYRGLDHISLVAAQSPLGPDLIGWSRDRFEARPAKASCQ